MSKRIYSLITSLVIFLFWLVTFLCFSYSINSKIISTIESVQLSLIGIFSLILFIFVEDTFYILPIFCYVPFMFSHSFDALTIPIGLYISLALAFIGAIIHFIKYKPKLIKPKLLLGIVIFLISLIIGGIFNFDNKYLLIQILFCAVISVLFSFGYSFFVSTGKKEDFKTISTVINCLAILLIFQEITYFIIHPDFSIKALNVGWGISNNIALILLFTLPFSLYMAIKEKSRIRYAYLLFIIVEFILIILTYSRGGIIISIFEVITLFIIGFLAFKKEKLLKPFILANLIFSLILLVSFGIICLKSPELIKNIYNSTIKGINFSTLNGRLKIYKEYISLSKNHLIFGHGILYPFLYSVDVSNGAYQWGHCTYIHTLFTLGIVGVLAITYHFIEKYYSVIKNINLEKSILLMCFIFSGLYGMIDISYFFINYMMVFIIIIILSDGYMEKLNLRGLFLK